MYKPPHSVRRPESQATSVKADIGSMRGSTASACGRQINPLANIGDEYFRPYNDEVQTITYSQQVPVIILFSFFL